MDRKALLNLPMLQLREEQLFFRYFFLYYSEVPLILKPRDLGEAQWEQIFCAVICPALSGNSPPK